jgi:MFS family permease
MCVATLDQTLDPPVDVDVDPTTVTRPPIVTPALLRVVVASVGSLSSFYLLLSVVPLYATSTGRGGAGAGLVTGALLLATVAGELATAGLVRRYGPRVVLGAGLVLLGAPALALTLSPTMGLIVTVCVVRGVGFALTATVGGALVASLLPPERRGEGLGLFGIVCGVPAIVALPLGVWLSGRIGYPPVFVAGAVVALVGVAVLPGLPGRAAAATATAAGATTAGPASGERVAMSLVEGVRTPAIVRPALAFSATALAAGIVVSFLPLAVGRGSAGLATGALLVQALAATAARWWAGRHSDRHGAAGLLGPALVLAAAGVALLVLVASPVAVVAAMVLFGSGFGMAQNVSLTLMLDRVAPSGYGTVSAIWNAAYDASMGLGAAAFGLLAGPAGYPTAFALTAAVMLVALVPVRAERQLAVRGREVASRRSTIRVASSGSKPRSRMASR